MEVSESDFSYVKMQKEDNLVDIYYRFMYGGNFVNYEIKTSRLLLRPLSIDDLDSVHIYASDNDNTKLSAHCDSRNSNSFKLMEKIGLTLESDSGTRTYPKNGGTAKELMYSLIIK